MTVRRSVQPFPVAVRAAAAWLAAVASHAMSTIPAQPTYVVDSQVREDRGTVGPITSFIDTRSGYNGNGASSAELLIVTRPGGVVPTLAQGRVNDRELKSWSQVGGGTGFATNGVTPFVDAHNRTSVTRYYQFRSARGLPTVSISPTLILDGALQTFVRGGDPFAIGASSVGLSLEIVDPAGNLLQTVFRLSATLSKPGCCLTPNLSLSVSGAGDRRVWEDSFVPRQTEGRPFAYDVRYLDTLTDAYRAPTGRPLGFRYVLETDASILGQFAGSADVFADFFNTATVGFELGTGEAGATFEELLSVAEPGWLGVPAAALAALAGRGRRTRSR